MLAVIISWAVRLLAATWRVRVVMPPGLLGRPGEAVLAFWHGKQLALLRARRPAVALVSWSRDGALSAGVLSRLGLTVVRGSSSRGGAQGLRALIRQMRGGLDGVFAVDGPRGPLARAKPGAALAAVLARAQLVPVGTAARRAWVLGRAWDRFEVPWPFTRVVIAVGEPVDARAAARDSHLLDHAISQACTAAVQHAESAAGIPHNLREEA
jgi:hypothetical protein